MDTIDNKENNYVSIKTKQTASANLVKKPKSEVTTKKCGPHKVTSYVEQKRLPMLNQSSLKSKEVIPTRQHKLNSSLKCIVNRQVTCNKCKIPTNLHSLVKCMACKRYYCLTCTDGTDYIDYICNSCFGEIKLNHLLNLLVLVIVCTFLRSMVISYLSRSCFNVITKIHFFNPDKFKMVTQYDIDKVLEKTREVCFGCGAILNIQSFKLLHFVRAMNRTEMEYFPCNDRLRL